jgi:hypothetical protein
MNIIKNINQYNNNYVYFCDPIKNNVMNEGMFIRILYSTPLFVLNGIYLSIHLIDVIIDKYYNKYKCIFNVNMHKDLIESIRQIEYSILEKIDIKDKIPQYKIYEHLKNGFIKIFTDTNIKNSNNNLFLLKISGIWETKIHYGVTYKFIKINHP